MERQDPAANAAPTCGECAHARIISVETLGKRACGRNPPTVFLAAVGNGGIGAITLRPEVKTTDVACGEFKPRQ